MPTIHPKIAAIAPIDIHWAIQGELGEEYLARINEAYSVMPADVLVQREAEYFAAVSQRIASKEKPYEVKDGTAYFSLEGLMTKEPTSASWLLGGTSTLLLRQSVRAAKADPAVTQGFMDTNSGGGQLIGTEELAADIADFAKVKPFTVFVSGLMGSAAMWACAGATSIYALKTASIGSIGIKSPPLVDTSRKLANEGVVVHSLAIGEHKAPGERGVPVTQAQIQDSRRHLTDLLAHFVAGVAEGRGFTEEQAAAVATGQIWSGDKALELGLIDGICSLDECLQTISQGTAGTQPPVAKAAPTKAPARAATAKKETSMRLSAVMQKLWASVSGNTELLATAGISDAEAAQIEASFRPVDPAVEDALRAADVRANENESRMASLETGLLNTAAAAFADDAILTQHRAEPSEREALISTFVMAAKADGEAGRAKFADGQVVEGANVKAIRDGIGKRRQMKIGAQIPDRDITRHDSALQTNPAMTTQSMVNAYNRQGAAR